MSDSTPEFVPGNISFQYIPFPEHLSCVKAAANEQTSDCFRIEEEETVEGKKGKTGIRCTGIDRGVRAMGVLP
jgi:hypothetical protein